MSSMLMGAYVNLWCCYKSELIASYEFNRATISREFTDGSSPGDLPRDLLITKGH